MDSGEQDIHDILTKKFQPKQLQVQDVSGECFLFAQPHNHFAVEGRVRGYEKTD